MLPKLFRRTAIKPLLSGAVVLFVVALLKDLFFGWLNKTMDKTWAEPIEALVGDRWYFALLISLFYLSIWFYLANRFERDQARWKPVLQNLEDKSFAIEHIVVDQVDLEAHVQADPINYAIGAIQVILPTFRNSVRRLVKSRLAAIRKDEVESLEIMSDAWMNPYEESTILENMEKIRAWVNEAKAHLGVQTPESTIPQWSVE